MDPDVQSTDQPYVFVNDDPLNAVDPLGLKGSIGSMCDGSDTCVAKDIAIIKKAASTPITVKMAIAIMVNVGGIFGPDETGLGEVADAEVDSWAVESVDEATQTVYRVHGGDSSPIGTSWTTQDPAEMANPRDELGLPNGNSGEFVSKARVLNEDGVERTIASALDGNSGGAVEWRFPNPSMQLRVESTIEVHPPY